MSFPVRNTSCMNMNILIIIFVQEPVEIKLGRNVKTVVRNSRRCHKILWDCGYMCLFCPLFNNFSQIISFYLRQVHEPLIPAKWRERAWCI